jgi:Tfp pilus assembly protein PilX
MRRDSSGQILLITLLVLTVGLTIALAMIGRSRTNVNIGNEIEDSSRAFNAAEAGIEQALKTASGSAQTLSGGLASYNTNVSAIGGGTGAFAFPQRTVKGDTETLWLVNHNTDGSVNETRAYTSNTIDVCWKGFGGTVPALSTIVLFKRGANYMVARAAYDSDGTRTPQNKFSTPNGFGSRCGQSAVNYSTITFSSLTTSPAIDVNSDVLIALRLRPIYADASIFVDSPTQLPRQGDIINSSGSTNTGVTRRIVVTREYRSAPTAFDAAVLSQLNFSH